MQLSTISLAITRLGNSGGVSGAALSLDMATGNSTLDPRITFSRTSNATLTGSDGLIQYAPHNLLTYSEQFDNAAWVKFNVSVVPNDAVAPDGTTTADELTVNGGAVGTYALRQTVTGAIVTGRTYIVSLWIKWISGTTTFSVDAGDGATVNQTVTSSWQRYSFTVVAGSAGSFIDLYSDGPGVFHIWGAQLNVGALQDYNSTTVKNLLGYTQEFDNAAWTKSNASISATKVDDIYGQPFAQKLVEDANNTTHFTRTAALTLGFPATFSCYMKAGERSWGYLQLSGSGSLAYFDLNSGVVGTTIGGTAEISSVGAGWYRCSLTDTTTTTAFAIIGVTNANGSLSYTGDGTSGIYIFGAQLSDSASVDPYVYNPVAAPSAAAYYGPRFDYDPITLAPKGLLIEEQRTNLVTYSEQFDNVAWAKTNASLTANRPDPAGGTKAFTLTASGGSATVQQAPTVTSGVALSASIWVKRVTGTGAINMRCGDATTIPVMVTSQWTRVAVTATPTSTTGRFAILVATDGDAIDIWGAQLEAGAFATSYIPTVASQVTRAADIALMQGANFSNWYNVNEGTMYGEADALSTAGNRVFTVGSASSLNYQLIALTSTGAVAGGVTQAQFNRTVNANQVYKNAYAYRANDFASSTDGAAVVTGTSGTVPTGLNRAEFGSITTGSLFVGSGHIRRIAYYNRRLSNSELQGITA